MSAREQFDDERMERLQARIAKLEGVIARCPFVLGVPVKDQAVDTTATMVSHRLGRAPNGVLAISASPVAAVGFSSTQPNDTSLFVNLEASTLATFDLWFF